MKLVRIRSRKKPQTVLEGTEKEIIAKIHELNLVDWHDAFFYENGKFENMGICGEKKWDYYMIKTKKDEDRNL